MQCASQIAALHGTCPPQKCCLKQNGECTALAMDTVTRGIAVSSKGCLSLLETNGAIATYKIDCKTCCLTLCGDTPFSITSGTSQSLAYSPSGDCLAAADQGSNNVTIFKVEDDCCLCPNGAPVCTKAPTTVAFSPVSCCLFLGKANFPPCSFKVKECKPRFKGICVDMPLFVSPQFAASPDGTCLAVIDNNMVQTYSIDSCTLNCTAVSSLSITSPTNLAFSPSGSTLIVTCDTTPATIVSFSVASCSLTQKNTFTESNGINPIQVAFNPLDISNNPCFAVAYQSSQSPLSGNGVLGTYTVDSSDNYIICPQNTQDPEPTSTPPILGRSVAWSSDGSCIYFVTQKHIWNYSVVPGSCSMVTGSVKPDALLGGQGSFARPLLLLGVLGLAAVGGYYYFASH